MAGRGGYRPNAGRPKAPHTRQAEEAKKTLILKFVKDKSLIFDALITKAKTGDIPAVKELFERVWGKPEQTITGKDGGAIQIEWLNSLQSHIVQEDGQKPSTCRVSAG